MCPKTTWFSLSISAQSATEASQELCNLLTKLTGRVLGCVIKHWWNSHTSNKLDIRNSSHYK